MKYRTLEPLEKIEAGDEFTWSSDEPIAKSGSTEGRDWYPCETFVGQRVEKLQRRSNVIFRRPCGTD